MARDEKGHFLPGNKEGRKIGAEGGLTAAEMQKLSWDEKKRKQLVADTVLKALFAPLKKMKDEERLARLTEIFGEKKASNLQGIIGGGLLDRALEGDTRAIELLLKLGDFYVERTENVSEIRTEFTNLQEWKEYVKGINE